MDIKEYTENEICEITRLGISLCDGMFIDFGLCAENYEKAYPGSSCLCVGERDITKYSFTFYTSPKPIMIKFKVKGKIAEFFSRVKTHQHFGNLQKKINEYGYRIYDMS